MTTGVRLTFDQVLDRMEQVIYGSSARLETDHWFIEMVDLDAQGSLTLHPERDAALIRQALWHLQALDSTDGNGNLIVSDDQLRATVAELRSAAEDRHDGA